MKTVQLKPESFELKKAVVSAEDVKVDYTEKKTADGTTAYFEHFVHAPVAPHPDLLNKMDEFKPYLAKAFCINLGFDLAKKHLKGKELKEIKQLEVDVMNNIEVTGVSISGSEQLKGAVISGKIKSWNGGKCAINTQRVNFESDKLGFEETIRDLVSDVETEIFEYLFKNKRAQLDLFDGNGDGKDIGENQDNAKAV